MGSTSAVKLRTWGDDKKEAAPLVYAQVDQKFEYDEPTPSNRGRRDIHSVAGPETG